MKRLFKDYGMLLVLLLLCLLFSALTITTQYRVGTDAANNLYEQISSTTSQGATVMIAGREQAEDSLFAETLKEQLTADGYNVLETALGQARDGAQALGRIEASGQKLDVIAATHEASQWILFEDVASDYPTLGQPQLLKPQSYRWPNFLKKENLLNISNQIAVIAILAIGMTMVIISGGIDLSVGSLIALSAVLTSILIRNVAGAEDAGTFGMILCCLGGITACGLIGLFTGSMVTLYRVPPFIVTLGMMLVASGAAYTLSGGLSVYQVPDSFVWLGRGADLLSIPNAVVLMLVLYGLAHFLMSHTKMGRFLYAVGGNEESARLSGVPVKKVLLFAYVVAGLLAGLGGVVMASQLKSGSPTYGQMYELYTIAAVVVGGTSLMGGEGKMIGTLIGAFIIAVIQNGMNLIGVEPYTQKIVLGAVILIAVWLDKVKQQMGNGKGVLAALSPKN